MSQSFSFRFIVTFLLLLLWSAIAASRPAAQGFLLAGVYTPGLPLEEYLVSEKLDGVRAWWTGEALVSRQGNRFAAPGWFIAALPDQPLDGELWMGRGSFEKLSGIVRQAAPHDGWRQVRFMVFDLPASPLPFEQRLQQLELLINQTHTPWLQLVEHAPAPDHRMLMQQLAEVTRQGGEGLMLRRRNSLYRAGRSGDLLKVKLREDAEARVIAHLPGKGKYQGKMGSLLVEMADGRRFRIGTGFTDEVRASPPPPGSQITFTYQGLTATGLPRFASFWRERGEDTAPMPDESALPEGIPDIRNPVHSFPAPPK